MTVGPWQSITPTIILLDTVLRTAIDTTLYNMTEIKFAEQERVTRE
jgi:hypothetical protein